MASKLYVGGINYAVDDDSLKEMFEEFGQVVSAQVILDRDSGQSKGFGFVEMNTDEEAQAAAAALDGKVTDNRTLVVNAARPKEKRPSGTTEYSNTLRNNYRRSRR